MTTLYHQDSKDNLMAIIDNPVGKSLLAVCGSQKVFEQLINDCKHDIDIFNFNSRGDSLTIDEVRGLRSSIQTIAGGGDVGKTSLVVIYGLERAKVEAQNALLKVLEEVEYKTLILIFAVKDSAAVIPTVASRLDKCQVLVNKDANLEALNLTDNPNAVKLATAILGNDLDLVIEVLSSAEKLKLFNEAVESAKQVVAKSNNYPVELASNLENQMFVQVFLNSILKIAEHKIKKTDDKQSTWQSVLETTLQATRRYPSNNKLAIDKLLLQLS